MVLGTTSAFAASVDTIPVETEAVDGDVSYTVTVVDDKDVDKLMTYSLDDANRTVLPDGTVQYTLENGIVITLVTEGVALAETN